MSAGSFHNPTPQFGTAEYVGVPGNDHCQYCHQPIGQTYYRMNDAMACPSCAQSMQGELAKDTHAAFTRGLLFGIGAAFLGMILYAAFAITTGLIIGYVSLAVGWLVAKAIMKGSGGIGGRRYQIAAAILTYAAVSMAAVPIWIHYAGKQRQTQKQTQQQKLAEEQRQLESEFGQPHQAPAEQPADAPRPSPPRVGFAAELAKLAMIGIASPFLELWEGGPNIQWAIGLIILVVGIRIAWRMTAARPVVIYGPFENSAPQSS
jgi:hypothetical protein